MKTMQANLLLLLAALIWGSAFVAQSIGADLVEPFTYLAARSVLGTLVLIPLVLYRRKKAAAPWNWKPLLLGGLCCGAALCAASGAQQIGMTLDASTSKAGFLTTLYVPMVPVISLLLFRKKTSAHIWISVGLAVAGLALLSGLSGGFSAGEAMLLVCALLFAVHILVVDHFAPKTDPVALSMLQFAACAVFSAVIALMTEQTGWEAMWEAKWSIAYAGVLSSGVAFTLQVVAQKHTNPTVASLLMSMESVFSCICGWIILHDALNGLELVGCGLMFAAVILAQLPDRKSRAVSAVEAEAESR